MEPSQHLLRRTDMPRQVSRAATTLGVGATVLLLLASIGGTNADADGADPHGAARPAYVEGTVLAGPRCPVERAERPCRPRPVPGAQVWLLRGNKVVARGITAPDGSFRLRSRPGRFVVRATNVGNYRSTASQAVTLRARKTETVRLLLDTGIR